MSRPAQIGARSLWNVTYAEVQEWLSQHGANGDGCFVAVMHNMEGEAGQSAAGWGQSAACLRLPDVWPAGFLKLPSGNVRDNFHVR